MEREISKLEEAANIRGESSPFDANTKASDEFLSPLFRNFAKSLQRPMELRKADFHKLVPFIPNDEVDPEIREKLDAICEAAKKGETANRLALPQGGDGFRQGPLSRRAFAVRRGEGNQRTRARQVQARIPRGFILPHRRRHQREVAAMPPDKIQNGFRVRPRSPQGTQL